MTSKIIWIMCIGMLTSGCKNKNAPFDIKTEGNTSIICLEDGIHVIIDKNDKSTHIQILKKGEQSINFSHNKGEKDYLSIKLNNSPYFEMIDFNEDFLPDAFLTSDKDNTPVMYMINYNLENSSHFKDQSEYPFTNINKLKNEIEKSN